MRYDPVELFSSLVLPYDCNDDAHELSPPTAASFANAFASPRRQSFSLPATITRYISSNWSSKVYSKLVKTCKYFLSTHKIFVISDCESSRDLCFDTRRFCLIPDQSLLYEIWEKGSRRKFKLDLSTGIKLWVTKEFYFRHDNPDFFMNSLKHIYRCDLTKMVLSGQRLTEEIFPTLKFLKNLTIRDCIFERSDGTLISYGELLSQTPSLTDFYCEACSLDGFITTPDGSLPFLKNLKDFFIFTNTLKNFIDLDAWCQFAKLNINVNNTVSNVYFMQGGNDSSNLEEVKEAVLKVFPDVDISKHVISSLDIDIFSSVFRIR